MPQESSSGRGKAPARPSGVTSTAPILDLIDLGTMLSETKEAEAGQMDQADLVSTTGRDCHPPLSAIGVSRRVGGALARRHGGPEVRTAAGFVPREDQVAPTPPVVECGP